MTLHWIALNGIAAFTIGLAVAGLSGVLVLINGLRFLFEPNQHKPAHERPGIYYLLASALPFATGLGIAWAVENNTLLSPPTWDMACIPLIAASLAAALALWRYARKRFA